METLTFKDIEKLTQKEVEIYSTSTKQNPIVTICVQTYNHEKFIEKCLNSVFNQNIIHQIEVIIGEDQSTDNTRKITKLFADKYDCTLYLHNRENNIKINGRATGRFNYLKNLFSANGKYLLFLDGDDYFIRKDAVELLLKSIDKDNNTKLSYGLAENFDESENKRTKQKPSNIYDSGQILSLRKITSSAAMLDRSSLIKNLPYTVLQSSIADMYSQYAAGKEGNIMPINKTILVRNIHSGGVFSGIKKSLANSELITSLHLLKEYIAKKDIPYYYLALNKAQILRNAYAIMEEGSYEYKTEIYKQAYRKRKYSIYNMLLNNFRTKIMAKMVRKLVVIENR